MLIAQTSMVGGIFSRGTISHATGLYKFQIENIYKIVIIRIQLDNFEKHNRNEGHNLVTLEM